MWTNGRGNHTWVEIWDGDWHFVGAAEPDPNGLDRGWFAHDASLAVKDDREHAIYASSFKNFSWIACFLSFRNSSRSSSYACSSYRR